MQSTKKLSPVVAALIVIVLVGIVTTAVVIIRNQQEETTVGNSTQIEDTQNEVSNESTSDTSAIYKNGTYTETGNYISPGGRESIEVTLTVTDDIITDASVKANAASSESKEHQDDFISGYKTLVVGKDIDEVSLSRVAGSSLTSNGFNSALKLIKADAGA